MNVVTGSFGYIGRYITRQLLDLGREVKTITTHPEKPNPFGGKVKAYRYHFDKPDLLIETLRGTSTLYNTYWIRFEYRGKTFEEALTNTATLFSCAREAGVQKIVHISVTQASEHSALPYYKGKGLQEQILAAAGVPYAIVRPTLVFGKEDILVNNIAWMIRKFPIFPIFGSGNYKVQPVYVGDVAAIAIAQSNGLTGTIVDAIGEETFTFEKMVRLIVSKLGCHTRLVHMSPGLGILCGKVIGLFCRDIVLTNDELKGLMEDLLTSSQSPNGTTRFSDWLEENRNVVGGSYSSELWRHFR